MKDITQAAGFSSQPKTLPILGIGFFCTHTDCFMSPDLMVSKAPRFPSKGERHIETENRR